MDGVLADFDSHHEAVFGFRSCKLADNVDWGRVRAVKTFYLDMPPMPDFDALWKRIGCYRPIVLTGVPWSVEEAASNKRAWVAKHIGPAVEVRCCQSKNKSMHCSPGDVLIDDWEKYRSLWVDAGGRWVTHVDAEETSRRLSMIGL